MPWVSCFQRPRLLLRDRLVRMRHIKSREEGYVKTNFAIPASLLVVTQQIRLLVPTSPIPPVIMNTTSNSSSTTSLFSNKASTTQQPQPKNYEAAFGSLASSYGLPGAAPSVPTKPQSQSKPAP
ncbi:hypothetical protein BD779DRAFT_1546131 [Infundibulicybe gibba]|nr:hypothetical protein BD779DRAFT_1546131 [Infundibulicybe gibba]